MTSRRSLANVQARRHGRGLRAQDDHRRHADARRAAGAAERGRHPAQARPPSHRAPLRDFPRPWGGAAASLPYPILALALARRSYALTLTLTLTLGPAPTPLPVPALAPTNPN
eukprot:scaffold66873_cov55-Phaeocystis_antarctica.AAC.3